MHIWSLAAALFTIFTLFHHGAVGFNPYEYDRKTAQCMAVRRGAEPAEVKINLSKYVCLEAFSAF